MKPLIDGLLLATQLDEPRVTVHPRELLAVLLQITHRKSFNNGLPYLITEESKPPGSAAPQVKATGNVEFRISVAIQPIAPINLKRKEKWQ